jgi:hypothetical protein
MKTANSIVEKAQTEKITGKTVFVYFESSDPMVAMSDGFWLWSEDPNKIALCVAECFSNEFKSKEASTKISERLSSVKDVASLKDFLHFVCWVRRTHDFPMVYSFKTFAEEGKAFSECTKILDGNGIEYDKNDEEAAFRTEVCDA